MTPQDVTDVHECRSKTERIIRDSKTREQLKTAQKYLNQFKISYPTYEEYIKELELILKEQDIKIHEYGNLFFWKDLDLEGLDEERKQWCKVTNIDVDLQRIELSNGVVRFTRDLNTVLLRSSKVLFKDKHEDIT